jgi:hypothetical protein
MEMILIAMFVGFPAVGESGLAYFTHNWLPNRSACPRIKRFGSGGDGGKEGCLVNPIGLDCHIVSVGSNNDFSFEIAVHRHYPFCRIDTYDPTVRFPRPPPFVTFHKTTVPQILKVPVFILKMDCEGCEYSDLLPLAANAQQILVEVHPCLTGSTTKDRLLLGALSKTHRLFSREHNRYGIRPGCMELSWIRANAKDWTV